jgi:hypothetical protein
LEFVWCDGDRGVSENEGRVGDGEFGVGGGGHLGCVAIDLWKDARWFVSLGDE